MRLHLSRWQVIGFAVWIAVFAWAAVPTHYWIVIRSVTVTDRYLGERLPQNRILEIERSINANFRATYTIEEQWRQADGAWLTVKQCRSPSVIQYRTDKALPDPVTAGWWAWGPCDGVQPRATPDDGELRLCTWHHAMVLPFLSVLSKSSPGTCSASYRGRLLPP